MDQPPSGDGWIHEIKHDGYRTLLVLDRGSVRAFTRNGHDWSDRYPGIVASAARLGCRAAILDGEVIVQDPRGASDFGALQQALRHWSHELIFYTFDILHLDGIDLRALPLVDRRAKLRRQQRHGSGELPALRLRQPASGVQRLSKPQRLGRRTKRPRPERKPRPTGLRPLHPSAKAGVPPADRHGRPAKAC